MIRRITKLTRLSLTSSTEAEQLTAAIKILSKLISGSVRDRVPHAMEELFSCGHVALVVRTIDCHDHEVRGVLIT